MRVVPSVFLFWLTLVSWKENHVSCLIPDVLIPDAVENFGMKLASSIPNPVKAVPQAASTIAKTISDIGDTVVETVEDYDTRVKAIYPGKKRAILFGCNI